MVEQSSTSVARAGRTAAGRRPASLSFAQLAPPALLIKSGLVICVPYLLPFKSKTGGADSKLQERQRAVRPERCVAPRASRRFAARARAALALRRRPKAGSALRAVDF